jgi:hypothetical protein
MNALAAQARHLTYQWDTDPLAEEFIRDVPLRAGSAVVYDPRILHGSGDNASDHPRVAFNCVTVPHDREARVYYWDEGPPGGVEAFEATESGLCELRYDSRPTAPYPDGLRLLEAFDVPREPMRIDQAALRRLQADVVASGLST